MDPTSKSFHARWLLTRKVLEGAAIRTCRSSGRLASKLVTNLKTAHLIGVTIADVHPAALPTR